jgi:hypothetical protein
VRSIQRAAEVPEYIDPRFADNSAAEPASTPDLDDPRFAPR